MTTIFFMRHSEAQKNINIKNSDSLQVQNEKWPLTINGENIACEKSKQEELNDFDYVYSSNYVRAVATAKYFTKDTIYIDESFGERKFGVDSWDELPENFEKKQFSDFNYKLENGESLNEVISREYKALTDILNNYKNKKILIVGHSTAMAALFSKWCCLNEIDGYKFKGVTFFDGKWGHCETFKLTFDDNNQLIDIKNIK